jgi:hypothetical protein
MGEEKVTENEWGKKKKQTLKILAEIKCGTQEERRGTKEMQTDKKTRERKVSVPQLSSPNGQNRLCGRPSVYRGELPGSKAAGA